MIKYQSQQGFGQISAINSIIKQWCARMLSAPWVELRLNDLDVQNCGSWQNSQAIKKLKKIH